MKKKKNVGDSGFTLIELLVAIIIIGILSAIALPSFLNQASRARASEAKTNISAVLRAQQAYYTENSEFASNLDRLALGIDRQTSNYKYDLVPLNQAENQAVGILAAPVKNTVKAHLGVIQANDNTSTFKSVICEADTAGLNEFTTATVQQVLEDNLKCSSIGKRSGK